MKYNLGHSMEPRVLCFKQFKHLLPQAKASAVVRNLPHTQKRGLLKKVLIKKRGVGVGGRTWIRSSLLALRERINIGHLGFCILLHLLFSENWV